MNYQIKTLAHALIEEHSSNGGHFSSPDTENFIRGLCEWEETPLECLKRLAGIKSKKSVDSRKTGGTLGDVL